MIAVVVAMVGFFAVIGLAMHVLYRARARCSSVLDYLSYVLLVTASIFPPIHLGKTYGPLPMLAWELAGLAALWIAELRLAARQER